MIWANLLHLSFNMWEDRIAPEQKNRGYRPYLRFDEGLWDELLSRMAGAGINTVVIDLGDGVRYESHPEIAVRGAWTPKRLRSELAKIRKLGMEPMPKLNFSTCHDAWLGPYARCVSTDAYYAVCRDLIAEVIDLFDQPRLFHLGMDEETASHQQLCEYLVVRQFDLWWHDLYLYIEEVEKGGSRAWVWSDYVWHHPEVFFKKMPKTVVQSNWYYGASFGKKIERVKAYLDLEARRYDQIPTGSNWSCRESFPKTVQYAGRNIAPKRLLGFLQTSWQPTLRASRAAHLEAIEMVEQARAKWEAKKGKK